MPQGHSNWVMDLDPSTPRTALLRVALEVRIGANFLYERGRALFVKWTGKE